VSNLYKVKFRSGILAPARLYRIVCKSYFFNLSIQYYSISKMAGKSKSVMGAVQPEEIKKVSRSLTEQWINFKKYNTFGGLTSKTT